MKKALLIVAVIIFIMTGIKEKEKNMIVIPDESIRLRVISNSNSEFDINEKLKLKSYLEDILYDLVKDCRTKEEVKSVILDNLDNINLRVYEFLGNNNYKIDFGQNFFPAKVYKGVVYNEGIYDSLVVTLGNGNGSNWWCVLFPPLCLLEENTNTTDVEYKFFVSSIINSLN